MINNRPNGDSIGLKSPFRQKQKNMKRFFNIIIAATPLLLGGCVDKLADTNMDLNADVDIHSFSIDGRQATIDNTTNTITLEIPGGSDMTALAPVIELGEGAVVMPVSGIAQDFSLSKSKPVEYTVSNGNMYNTYKVTLTEVRPRITNVKLGNYTVILDDEAMTIEIYTDGDENITSLAPIIEFTENATLAPASGEAVNFTNPVQYTLSFEGHNYVYTAKAITTPVYIIYNGEEVKRTWSDIAAGGVLGVNVANPGNTGVNPTPYCMSIPRKNTDTDDGGREWSGGGIFDNQVNILPGAYGKLSVKVLKQLAGPVTLELQGPGVDNLFITAQYEEEYAGEWQELFFTIPRERSAPITAVLIRPHNTQAGLTSTPTLMYWDEMRAYPRGSLPSITAFSINGIDGVVDQTAKTITIDGSNFSDITALSAVVAASPANAGVSPSGAVDFTSHPITYTVTSSEGVSVDYRVRLTGVPVIIYNGETVFAAWEQMNAWDAANNRTFMGANIDNPQADAVNSTAHCMSVPRVNGGGECGNPWTGAALWQADNIQIDFDPQLYGAFKMMIRKPLTGQVAIEIQDNNPVDASRVKHFLTAQYTTANQWQELTFNIPAERTASIMNILIRVHDTQDGLTSTPVTMYWDELKILPR
jgi:hypothetical protein